MKNKNSRWIVLSLALSLALPFAVATVQAQTEQQPSAKVTAKTSRFVLITNTTATSDWVTILSNDIKTAEQKDLFVTAALEAGLYTQTQVISGNTTSTATARVQVRVLVDGVEIEPGPITYADRTQTISALLLPAQMIDLIQRTMAAASFSWVGIDIPVGVHNVAVQARVDTESGATSAAMGGIGKGTMTVESVRLIKGEDVPLVP